jgi:hypothetical protein
VIAVLIAAIVIALVIVAVVIAMRRRTAASPGAAATGTPGRPRPSVAEFHVSGSRALVSFDVPLPAGDVDTVLRDLLVREAIEVVREKRHQLPIDDVTEVVALGRRDGAWEQVGSVDLNTPGELPPPMMPELLPGLAHDPTFDPFEKLAELPEQAPGLAPARSDDRLAPLSEELRLPAAIESGLRAQGVDPVGAGAGDVVLGVMRMTGYVVAPASDDTFEATRAGTRTLVRLVGHTAGDHPELAEGDIRRFAVDFASSGADRGLLITEKYGPFEIYERERREPRARFITRERLQGFLDALTLG